MEMLKILASLVTGLLGGYYLWWRGVKKQDTRMILWGLALTVLSYLIFSGGSDDQAAKELLKKAIPSGEAASTTPVIQ